MPPNQPESQNTIPTAHTATSPKSPKKVWIWILCFVLLLATTGAMVYCYVAPRIKVENTDNKSPDTSQSAAVIHSNAILTLAGNQYDLYLLVSDGATTTGQFFLLDKEHQNKIMLDQPFAATNAELTDFMAVSVSKLIVSGNAAYIAFDQGTSVERGWSVFSIATGKKVISFCGLHDPLFWNDIAVYLACDRSMLNTAFEAGAPSIEAVNLLTDATTTLVASNIAGRHFSYQLGQIDGNELTFDSTELKQTNGTWDFFTNTPTDLTLDLSQKLSSWVK